MNLNELIHLQGLLFSRPDQGWVAIKKASFTWQQMLVYYLLPLVFLSTLMTVFFMGDQFSALGFSPNQMFLITFGGSVMAIFISAYMIASMAPRFLGLSSFDTNFALLSFSYSPVFLISIISSLHEILQIFNLAAIVFTLFLFFKGTLILVEVPKHKQMGFTIVSLIILFGTRLIISVVLASLMGGIPM